MKLACLTFLSLFGFVFGNFCHTANYCPEGSCLFILPSNDNGTCPNSLPMVDNEEDEERNPCDMVINYLL
jgi:hypothetical protein